MDINTQSAFVSTFEKVDYETKIFYITKKPKNIFF